MRSRDIT